MDKASSSSSATQATSIKVSIFGKLTAGELRNHFSQFGTVIYTPYIFSGNPQYSYIDFATPGEAQAALSQKHQTINGAPVQVKLKYHASSPSPFIVLLCLILTAFCPFRSKLCVKNCESFYILGDKVPSSDELCRHFCQFGTVVAKPFVFPGSPKYSFIDFALPSEAQTAASNSNQMISGAPVQVKLKQASSISHATCSSNSQSPSSTSQPASSTSQSSYSSAGQLATCSIYQPSSLQSARRSESKTVKV